MNVFLSRAATLAQRVPGIVYVVIFASLAASAALTALVKNAERKGAAEQLRKTTIAAEKDSLRMAADMGRILAHEDSAASLDRAEAAERVRAAQRVRQQRSHQVHVVNDTTVTVVTSAGADSTVTVAPQIVTALTDAKAQITSDSLALKTDSTKLETQAAKASNDSTKAVLTTRIEDHTGEPAADDGHSLLGAAATVLVDATKIGLVVVGVIEGARLVLHFIHH